MEKKTHTHKKTLAIGLSVNNFYSPSGTGARVKTFIVIAEPDKLRFVFTFAHQF